MALGFRWQWAAVLLFFCGTLAVAGPPEKLIHAQPIVESTQTFLPASAVLNFALAGRISVRHDDTAYHGNLDWQHTAEKDDITLTGPFGQGIAVLHRDTNGALLKLADGATYRSSSLDDLANRLFGGPLPVSALQAWVLGFAPDALADAQGRPQRLQYQEWLVEWLSYMDAQVNARPRLLVVTGPNLSLRIRIDHWDDEQ